MFCLPPFDYFTKEMLVIDCAQMSARMVRTGFYPSDLAYNPRSGRAFVPLKNVEDIAVFDCATDSLVARIPTHFYPSALGYSSRENRVYVASASQEYIVVLDGETSEVLGTIPMWFHNDITDGEYGMACYNPELNKMYISTEGAEDIVVIDCAADTVLAVLETLSPPADLCLSPLFGTRLYCGARGRLEVFDGHGDTLITRVRLPGHVRALDYDSRDGEVYASLFFGLNATVAVSCSLNRIAAEIDIGGWDVLYNPIDHKVYLTDDHVHVFDAGADTSIATLDTIGAGWFASCFNDREDKAYFAGDLTSCLLVVNGASDSLIAVIYGQGAIEMCYNRTNNKLYLAQWSRELVVVDGAGDSVLAEFDLEGRPTALAWNPVQNRVYVADYDAGKVVVFRDSLIPGVAEDKAEGGRMKDEPALPTILRGPELKGLDCRVIDALGRDVTDRRERLAPGVYFLKDEGGRLKDEPGSRAAVQKVIVQR
jgi:DNA-binding beta-propeller fold protein YncE